MTENKANKWFGSMPHTAKILIKPLGDETILSDKAKECQKEYADFMRLARE